MSPHARWLGVVLAPVLGQTPASLLAAVPGALNRVNLRRDPVLVDQPRTGDERVVSRDLQRAGTQPLHHSRRLNTTSRAA